MSEHVFTDPIRHQECTLIVRPGWVGIFHPGCSQSADVCIPLDSFYCPSCKYSGRMSGAWVVDLIERAEADEEVEYPDHLNPESLT